MRYVFSVLAIVVLFGVGISRQAFSEANNAEEQGDTSDMIQRDFDLGGQPAINLKNIIGAIKIEAKKSGPVELKIKKQGGTAEERGWFAVNIKAEGKTLKVETRCIRKCAWKSDDSCCKGKEVKVNYQLLVPVSSTINTKNVNGHIEIKGVQGELEVSTVNGSVRTEGTQAASLQLKTVNGSIHTDKTVGPLKAETVNGKIEIQRGNTAKGDINVNTVNGAIHISLSTPANVDFEASTLSGAIKVDFTLKNESISRRSVRAKIGNGGSLVRAKTVNGSITLAPLS